MTDIAWHNVIERANGDGEFRIAARLWDARVRLDLGANSVRLSIEAGTIRSAERCEPDAACDASISGEADRWERLLAAPPPPLWQDLFGAAARGDFLIGGDLEAFFAYYPAMRRLLDLVREENRT
jgi:hypothetical protein